jgi:hypothetical protein
MWMTKPMVLCVGRRGPSNSAGMCTVSGIVAVATGDDASAAHALDRDCPEHDHWWAGSSLVDGGKRFATATKPAPAPQPRGSIPELGRRVRMWRVDRPNDPSEGVVGRIREGIISVGGDQWTDDFIQKGHAMWEYIDVGKATTINPDDFRHVPAPPPRQHDFSDPYRVMVLVVDARKEIIRRCVCGAHAPSAGTCPGPVAGWREADDRMTSSVVEGMNHVGQNARRALADWGRIALLRERDLGFRFPIYGTWSRRSPREQRRR